VIGGTSDFGDLPKMRLRDGHWAFSIVDAPLLKYRYV
jgi:hypothetical protein